MIFTPSNRYILEKGKIAVLLATYNGERYLQELLQSLLRQSHKDFCCFIHDDGSHDGTIKILEEFCSQFPEYFVLVGGDSTGGAKYNFMYLLKCVEADYYMFCDQDDVWLPDKVELTYDLMIKQNSDIPLVVYSDLKIVDANLDLIDSSYYHYTGKNPIKTSLIDLLKSNVTVGCTMMINRILRDKSLQIYDIDNIFMHDWWMSLIASAIGKVIFLDQQTILYRQHGNNSIGAIKKKKLFEKVAQYIDYKQMLAKKKYYIQRPIKFCRELSNVVGQECKGIDFIKAYAAIDEHSKIERIRFYRHWNLFNENSNVIWQMLWV